MQITQKRDIQLERVSDLLCSALEGGANYWYMITDKKAPEAWEVDSARNFSTMKPEQHFLHDYPLNKGGSLTITDKEEYNPENDTYGKKYILDLNTIKRGLEAMAEKYPGHFADFMQENDDADTGDVFLQCCLFGEIIYG